MKKKSCSNQIKQCNSVKWHTHCNEKYNTDNILFSLLFDFIFFIINQLRKKQKRSALSGLLKRKYLPYYNWKLKSIKLKKIKLYRDMHILKKKKIKWFKWEIWNQNQCSLQCRHNHCFIRIVKELNYITSELELWYCLRLQPWYCLRPGAMVMS